VSYTNIEDHQPSSCTESHHLNLRPGVRARGDALPACDESVLATSLVAGASVENVGLPPVAADGVPDGTESAPDHALSDLDEDLGR
jgi:hypothetical protein